MEEELLKRRDGFLADLASEDDVGVVLRTHLVTAHPPCDRRIVTGCGRAAGL